MTPAAGGRPLQGLLRPVDYAARTRYRRPPALYRRIQGRLGPALIGHGLAPWYAVVLEVPGRRTGVVHRTSLVLVHHGGEHYLVSLAGESEWVRNVRAACGRAVLGRRVRRAVTLIEVPVAERGPVLHAYLRRPGPRGRPVDRSLEARRFFGIDRIDIGECARIARHYPVFRAADATAGTAPG